jgi:hypothetical protein
LTLLCSPTRERLRSQPVAPTANAEQTQPATTGLVTAMGAERSC